MQRQAGQRSGRDHNEVAVAREQRSQGTEQLRIKRVGKIEIERARNALVRYLDLLDRGAKLRDGINQLLVRELDFSPHYPFRTESPHVAPLLAHVEENQNLAGSEQLLRL